MAASAAPAAAPAAAAPVPPAAPSSSPRGSRAGSSADGASPPKLRRRSSLGKLGSKLGSSVGSIGSSVRSLLPRRDSLPGSPFASPRSSRGGSLDHSPRSSMSEGSSWEVNPVQELLKGSGETVSALAESSLKALGNLAFDKKKKVTGLVEVEQTLKKLVGKLRSEAGSLKRFEDTEEVSQALLFLQETLVLLARKLVSVHKRKFFLSRRYSKRMLTLHQSLGTGVNDLLMTLQHKVLTVGYLQDDAARQLRAASLGKSEMLKGEAWDRAMQEEEHKAEDDVPHADADTEQVAHSLLGAKWKRDELSDDAGELWERSGAPAYRPMRGATPAGHDEDDDDEPESEREGESPREEQLTEQREEEEEEAAAAPAAAPAPVLAGAAVQTEEQSPKSAEETDDADELYNLAVIALNRREREEAAVALFARAAEMGHIHAMLQLGRMHERGVAHHGPELGLARRFLCCAKELDAALGGGALALFDLRNAASAGAARVALSHLRTAARRGDAESLCALGEFHAMGRADLDLAVDRSKAKALFAAAAAPPSEHARAQNNLAVLLLADSATLEQGMELLEVAASKGLAVAQNNLGMRIEGVPLAADGAPLRNANASSSAGASKLEAAAELYRKAAAQGLPLGMHNLAFALLQGYDGRGRAEEAQAQARAQALPEPGSPVTPEPEDAAERVAQARAREAAALLTSAAAHGVVDSLVLLAELHERGLGVPRDLGVASHLLKRVLVTRPPGDPLFERAALRLANLFYAQRKFPAAWRLYRKCAERGCAVSTNALGLMLEQGVGDPHEVAGPDVHAARLHYERASALGLADAKINVALLHLRGAGGLERDVDRALRDLHQVDFECGGHAQARKLIDALRKAQLQVHNVEKKRL